MHCMAAYELGHQGTTKTSKPTAPAPETQTLGVVLLVTSGDRHLVLNTKARKSSPTLNPAWCGTMALQLVVEPTCTAWQQ
jgi:hypothetical protein